MTNNYEISNLETERFKMNILRAKVQDINIKELSQEIFKNNIDITFLRVPSESFEQIYKIDQLGFNYSQVDTLVYYFVDFSQYSPKELRNEAIEFKKAKSQDKQILRALVNEIFPGYTNHYNSNPFLTKENILEGYVEWVLNYIEKDNKEVFLIYKNSLPIAFATCNLEDEMAEGVLYGVHPDHSGGGIYSDIIRYTQKYYFDLGIMKMKVSTQIQNFAVQKVWTREGFVLKESYNTIHINSLLNYSVLEKKHYEFKFTEDVIEKYANLSLDYNKVHFDDQFAKKLGFKEKIGHGLIVAGEISRIFGTEFPGDGTIFMNYKNIFLKPLYADQDYEFILSTPLYNIEKGILYCLIKVVDKNKDICMLSYNNLMNRLI